MKLCWSNLCHKLRTRGNVGSICCVLACSAGIVYSWNFGCCCTLVAAGLSLFAAGCAVASHWCTTGRDDPKDMDVVLVTGCDTGLGYSLALHLRSIGFRVIAAVHKADSPGALELSNYREIFVHPLDITIGASVTNFGKAVRSYLDRNKYVLRGFVNNAGAMIFGEFEWQTDEQTRHQVEVNLLGTMRVTREFLPIIRSHGTRLIIVTSHCAREPLPGVAVYGATKAGLDAWSTSLRVELKKYGVDVVTFVPGSFIGQSNLLAQQRGHFDVMEAAMSEDTRLFYGDYFTRYANYLSNLAPKDLPQRLMDPLVYTIFEGALLDRNPSAAYRCEPWRYMMYRLMFAISPTNLRDRLVESFVQMPAWKVNGRVENAAAMDSSRCGGSSTSAKATKDS